MIRVTLTVDLPEWWGAEYAWANGGAQEVKELMLEDVIAMIDDAEWKIEQIDTAANEDVK